MTKDQFNFSAQRVMHNFLPQFPGSIVTPQQQQQHSSVGAKAAGGIASLASSNERDGEDEDAATFSDLRAWAMSKPTEKSDEYEEPLDLVAPGEGQIAEEKGIALNEDTAKSELSEREDPVASFSTRLEPPVIINPSEPIGIVPQGEPKSSASEPVDLSTKSRDSTPVLGSFTLTVDGRPVPSEKLHCPVCGEAFEVE